MSAFVNMLSIFGIKQVKSEHYYILCRNTPSRTIYFRCFKRGIAEFTLYREAAYRFECADDARTARMSAGLNPRELYIEEIRKS